MNGMFLCRVAPPVVAGCGRVEVTSARVPGGSVDGPGAPHHECAVTSASALTLEDVGCPCDASEPSPAYQCGHRGMVLACISYEVREVPREQLVSEEFPCP